MPKGHITITTSVETRATDPTQPRYRVVDEVKIELEQMDDASWLLECLKSMISGFIKRGTGRFIPVR